MRILTMVMKIRSQIIINLPDGKRFFASTLEIVFLNVRDPLGLKGRAEES